MMKLCGSGWRQRRTDQLPVSAFGGKESSVGPSNILRIQFPAVAITIPDERANRYLVRIVKGLLTHLYLNSIILIRPFTSII
jgi:hypothetical protein